MKKLEYIWLSNIEISNQNKFKLIEKFEGIENLYNCSFDDLVELGIKDEISYKILDKSLKEKALKDFEYMKNNKIDILTIEDNEYPNKFKKLKDKPVCIYIRGNRDILNNEAIGIVGSRIAFKESLEISRLVANTFVSCGVNVVSGLAKGIDKFAHLGALDIKEKNDKSGKTIGVLACGLDKNSFYPRENLKLYERIIDEGGLVISEHPIGAKPKPYFFPYRNRLISGLSDRIFLVQASNLKSGSIITVDYALEQGKDIYVYKSPNIDKTYFQGNKFLIEEGAKIIEIKT